MKTLFYVAYKEKRGCRETSPFMELVELAGVEPASAIPTSSVLHAYSVFLLTSMTPTDRLQLLASPIEFNASAPDKASTRVYLRSNRPDPVSQTKRWGTGLAGY